MDGWAPICYQSCYITTYPLSVHSSGTPGLTALQQQGELRGLLQEAGAFSS